MKIYQNSNDKDKITVTSDELTIKEFKIAKIVEYAINCLDDLAYGANCYSPHHKLELKNTLVKMLKEIE